jgi:hypothetical protein
MGLAHSDEFSDVAAARKIKLIWKFFVMDPKRVSGDDLDAATLHFEYLSLPLVFRSPCVMELAHNG